MSRTPIPGIFWARCVDCGLTWKETTRDVWSPSHKDCPNQCDHGGEVCVIKAVSVDLPTDDSGNLLKYERITFDSEPAESCSHDYEDPERVGRAYYLCKKCGTDISLDLFFLHEALESLEKSLENENEDN